MLDKDSALTMVWSKTQVGFLGEELLLSESEGMMLVACCLLRLAFLGTVKAKDNRSLL